MMMMHRPGLLRIALWLLLLAYSFSFSFHTTPVWKRKSFSYRILSASAAPSSEVQERIMRRVSPVKYPMNSIIKENFHFSQRNLSRLHFNCANLTKYSDEKIQEVVQLAANYNISSRFFLNFASIFEKDEFGEYLHHLEIIKFVRDKLQLSDAQLFRTFVGKTSIFSFSMDQLVELFVFFESDMKLSKNQLRSLFMHRRTCFKVPLPLLREYCQFLHNELCFTKDEVRDFLMRPSGQCSWLSTNLLEGCEERKDLFQQVLGPDIFRQKWFRSEYHACDRFIVVPPAFMRQLFVALLQRMGGTELPDLRVLLTRQLHLLSYKRLELTTDKFDSFYHLFTGQPLALVAPNETILRPPAPLCAEWRERQERLEGRYPLMAAQLRQTRQTSRAADADDLADSDEGGERDDHIQQLLEGFLAARSSRSPLDELPKSQGRGEGSGGENAYEILCQRAILEHTGENGSLSLVEALDPVFMRRLSQRLARSGLTRADLFRFLWRPVERVTFSHAQALHLIERFRLLCTDLKTFLTNLGLLTASLAMSPAELHSFLQKHIFRIKGFRTKTFYTKLHFLGKNLADRSFAETSETSETDQTDLSDQTAAAEDDKNKENDEEDEDRQGVLAACAREYRDHPLVRNLRTLSLNNFNAMTYSLPALQQGLLDWAEGKCPDRLSAFCTAARRAQNALMKSRPKRGDDVDDGSEGGDEAEEAEEEEGEGESEVIAVDDRGEKKKKSPRPRVKKQI